MTNMIMTYSETHNQDLRKSKLLANYIMEGRTDVTYNTISNTIIHVTLITLSVSSVLAHQ